MDVSATGIVKVLFSLKPEDTGKFFSVSSFPFPYLTSSMTALLIHIRWAEYWLENVSLRSFHIMNDNPISMKINRFLVLTFETACEMRWMVM